MNLPADINRTIALNLDISDIFNYCVNRTIKNDVCDNELFWRLKYQQDFGLPNNTIYNWKLEYINKYFNNGYIYGCGLNDYNQLMLDDNQYKLSKRTSGQRTIIPIPLKLYCKFIACGSFHTIFIDENDNVYGCGENEYGQLGLGEIKNFKTPTQLYMDGVPFKAKFVVCNISHTIFIDLNDNVYGCGSNKYGQLGFNPNLYDKIIKMPIPLDYRAKFVACGNKHTIFIDVNDNVYGCGSNRKGQLGLEDYNEYKIGDIDVMRKILPAIKAKFVACRSNHTIIIDKNNNAYACGWDIDGSVLRYSSYGVPYPRLLKFGRTGFKANFVAFGGLHTIFIDENDYVYGCGINGHGQLGQLKNIKIYEPEKLLYNGQQIQADYVVCGHGHTIIMQKHIFTYDVMIDNLINNKLLFYASEKKVKHDNTLFTFVDLKGRRYYVLGSILGGQIYPPKLEI